MAVDDIEPLTATEDEGDDMSCRQDKLGQRGGDKFNALLTSALHKHAATKLGKKKKKLKDSANTDLDSVAPEKRSRGARPKGTWTSLDKGSIKNANTGKTRKSENIELVDIHQKNAKTNKVRINKNWKKKRKSKDKGSESCENLEIHSKSLSKETLIDTQEHEKNMQESENENEPVSISSQANDVNEAKADVCKESPKTAYLRDVAVPKTKKNKKKIRKYRDSGFVLSIIVHCADRLEGSLLLMPHPIIQIHVCNSETGQWLSKSDNNRRVTSFYEGANVDYILPVMTQPYDIRKNRSLNCKWEEEIVFNEDIEHFQRNDSQVILFFQLMDFPGSIGNNTSNITGIGKDGKGWTTFAWAFLKVVGTNGHKNIGQRLRLQLWRPVKSASIGLNELHSWWKSGSRIRYPSTLYITLGPTTLQQDPPPALRSTSATQAEQGGAQLTHILDHSSSLAGSITSVPGWPDGTSVEWDRKPNQSCKIPNRIKYHLSVDSGCLVVKFSHNGIYLACGAHKDLLIYNILSGQLLLTLNGHFGLIYDVTWSETDNLLLTASADSTARVWNIEAIDSSNKSQVLAHPSFVYVARFVPGKSRIIVTGCYDHVLRVWYSNKGGLYNLNQEITNHLGFISALCFSHNGNILYSGDKQGLILVWNVDKEGKKDEKKSSMILSLENEIKLNEVIGTTINALDSHPSGHRLLVHTRDSQMRFVNHNYWTITHRLRGFLNVREQIRGCMSPCGLWTLSGSEDQGVFVWNADSGEMVSAFMDLPIDGTTSCVDFHPHGNIIAISSCSQQAPVLILSYDETSTAVNTSIPLSVLPASSSANNVQSINKNENTNATPRKNAMEASSSRSQSPRTPKMSPTSIKKSTNKSSKKYDHLASTVDKNNECMSESAIWEERSHRILSKLDTVLRLATEEPLKQISYTRYESPIKPLGHVMRVQYDYKATEIDELSLKKGDFVFLVEKSNADWWTVSSANGHQRGVVPATYLQEISATEQEIDYQHFQEEKAMQSHYHQQQHQLTDDSDDSHARIIVVPSSSGEISFITDVEGTPKKSRARQRRHSRQQNGQAEEDFAATHKIKIK